MTLLLSLSEEFDSMHNTAELEGYINDMADICCLSRRAHPKYHEAIMDKFVEIADLARQAFGWTLTTPIGHPEGLSESESSHLQALMTAYEFTDDVWTDDKEELPMD